MKSKAILGVLTLAAVFVFAGGAMAATQTMPVLYNAAGQAVNTSGGTLASGNYYLTPGGQVVYYYGDGTYYNPALNTYGGSVYDPAGTAGPFTTPDSGSTSVGIPNTGAGGNAGALWATLALAAAASVAGGAYLARGRYAATK